MPQKIIIDSDPGLDDMQAIFFALQSPEVEVLGITTVFGNSGLESSTRNAIRMVETAGRPDIPVAAGASRALLLPPRVTSPTIHGADGAGNATDRLPPVKGKAIDRLAANFIIDTVMANPGEVILVPIGPITNIALAARLQPAIIDKVKGVVLMGGSAFAGGNASAAGEANLHNDPHAAKIVFEAGWPIAMAGLDVMFRYLPGLDYLDEIAAIGNPVSNYITEVLAFSRQRMIETGRPLAVPDLHALGYLIAPDLYTTRRMPCYIETEGLSAGQTVVDQRLPGGAQGRSSDFPEIDVILDVDADRLRKLFIERISAFGR
ncbi:MAG: nucleoside hydrolase [Anaerolineae bacterium]|nr:nucleoside hydrolase [Anaerolineae bacterium]